MFWNILKNCFYIIYFETQLILCFIITDIFTGIELVILLGVAGAVPNYTDCLKHVRLGDVVVSGPHT